MNSKIWVGIVSALITGILSINTLILVAIKTDLSSVDDKIWNHMTNDDIHVPREYTVSRSEFELYKMFQRDMLDEIKSSLTRIENKVNTSEK